MKIALLNVRITIQKSTITADSIGNRKSTWADYYICAATVSGEGNGETDDAGTTVDTTDVDFTVRYCSETAEVNPLGYRVKFDNEFYDIVAVDHMNYKHKAIKLRCQKARR